MLLSIDREGRSVAVEVHGDAGVPCVCVHGIGDTRSTWRELVPELLAAGYRVYGMDLRGHGDSDVGFPSYTAADVGGDVVALLTQQDLRGAVLVGNSIGGGAICRAAVEAPDRVARLVLVNPFVRDMPADRWLRPIVPLLFAQPWGAWAWGRYRETLFVSRPPDQASEDAGVLANLRQPGRMAAVRAMLRASKADIAARLEEIAVPCLVLMGDRDPDYSDPAAEGEVLRALLPGDVEVVLLGESGHYPQAEHPRATARAIVGSDAGALGGA